MFSMYSSGYFGAMSRMLRPSPWRTSFVEPPPPIAMMFAQLLHDTDVVEVHAARLCPADVFKAAGHELLPVQIVGRVALRGQPVVREVEHFRHLGRGRRWRTLQRNAGAFFSDSVCTVIFSGASASTLSSVSRKPSALSDGSPAMRSMFTAKPPTARTFSSASTMSAELCRRPIVSSTESDIVCGLTLTRSTPWARRTRGLILGYRVGASGLDGVFRAPRSNSRSSAVHSLSSWAAFSVVGVPPPMYIDTTRGPSARSSAPTAETSL